MNIKCIDNNYIIYIKQELIDIDFNNKEELEKYFKHLFKKLKKIYHIEIKGYYHIKVYIDKYYGVVLELKKEEFEYYDYLDNQVDMQITIINTSFLYQVNDIFIQDKVDIYKYDNQIYLCLNKKPSLKDINKLSEFSIIYYKTELIESNLEKIVL